MIFRVRNYVSLEGTNNGRLQNGALLSINTHISIPNLQSIMSSSGYKTSCIRST